MKYAKVLTATIFFYSFISHSCSQPAGDSKKISFEATTPCSDEIKLMVGIPASAGCEMMKWNLSLYRDVKDLPSVFDLTYTYGSAKQGTRGFKEGATTITLKGKWTSNKTTGMNNDDNVLTLLPTNSAIRLSFLQPDQGLLHFLNKDGSPMVGTAAWSFTLNNTGAVGNSPGKIVGKELTSTGIVSDTDTTAVFLGRTPCDESLRKLKNISAEGCQIIKCKLILLQDIKTQSPTNFVIQTIYVGKGDNRYSTTGKWKILQGSSPNTMIYQLLPDSFQPGNEILLLKAGDVLFFIDKNSHFLVGDGYSSYTLNRENKTQGK